ncbi:Ubiquinone biosynthesis protein COQ9, mitochondrial [Armadillidium vulgare]|nr:Ubiquinone biosynthesis protein COQ9, mitochondrial [Armadillidium vulgare]
MKSLYKIFQTFSSISRTIPKPCLLMKSKHIPLSSYSLHFRQYCSGTTTKMPKDNTPTGDSGESSSSSSSSEESDETEAEMDLRVSILEASLPFVHTSGWSSESLSRGAESLGYSNMLHGMFPNGGVELVNHVFKKCNDKLENEVKEWAKSGKYSGRTPVSTTTFITDAVEFRLRMNIEYIDTWAKALALHASPNNWSTAFDNVTTIIDTIWYYAGDRSVDSTWYARRGSLLLIYKSTELCLLQDKSEDYKDTWSFLSRRLNEAESLEKFVNLSCNRFLETGTVAKVGITTIQNMLGFNTKST